MSPKSIISSPQKGSGGRSLRYVWTEPFCARGWLVTPVSCRENTVHVTMYTEELVPFILKLASYRKCEFPQRIYIQYVYKKSSPYLLNQERVGEILLVRKQTGERCVFPHRSAQRVGGAATPATPSRSGGSGTNRAPRSKAEREGGREGSGAHVYDLWSLRTRRSAAWTQVTSSLVPVTRSLFGHKVYAGNV